MEARGYPIRGLSSLLILAGTVVLAYYFLRQINERDALGILLPVIGVLCFVIFLNPRLGLYAFCFTLILVPYDWRIEGLKFTSANVLVVGAASIALVTSLVVRRQSVRISPVVLPLLVVVVVAGLNYFRYGSGFLNLPYVLAESLVLFVLTTHLIRKDDHVQQLLVAIAVMIIIRSLLDLWVTIVSFQAGDPLGVIRHDRLLVAGTVTTESEWRSLLLPVLAMGALFAPKRSLQILFLGALFLDVAWLAFAASRTAILGLTLTIVMSLVVAPPGVRRRVLRLAIPAVVVVVVLMAVLSEAWAHIAITSKDDIFTESFEEGRWALWGGAIREFWKNPWIGNSRGEKHSFILEDARSMGMVFLVPYGIAAYLIWRHLSKLRRLRPPGVVRGYVYGLQAIILMVGVMGVTGSLLNTGVNTFLFWMLVGAAEGYYLQQRKDHQSGVASSAQGYFSRLRFRRRSEVSAGGALP